jgi:hypothetical protein
MLYAKEESSMQKLEGLEDVFNPRKELGSFVQCAWTK